MTTAPGSSSDTGRPSDDGEMSTTSPLLPTPTAGDGKSSGSRNLPGSGAHPGTSLTDAVRADRLLPTPNAGATNYDDPSTWRARQQILKAKGINGNGAGEPLGVVVRELTSSSEDSPASQPVKQEAGGAPTTTAGFGLPSPVSLASYDPALSSWRTSQVSLLSTEDERFPRSWERWPTSGMTRRGQAFALPMSERPTAASGSSSSLRTPMANEKNPGGGGELRAQITLGPERRNGTGVDSRGRPNKGRTLPTPAARDWKGRDLASREGGQSLPQALLPTPEAWLGRRPSSSAIDQTRIDSRRHEGDRGRRSITLPEVITPLLPTPRTPTGGPEPTEMRRARGNVHGTTLESALWDSLGEATPPPSNDGSE